MAETDILQTWNCFYSHFQNSKSLSQVVETETVVIQRAGASLLFDTGKSFAFDLFQTCGLLGGDVVKFNYILWKLEEKCLPQIFVMFEDFRKSLDLDIDKVHIPQDNIQDRFAAKTLPTAETTTDEETLIGDIKDATPKISENVYDSGQIENDTLSQVPPQWKPSKSKPQKSEIKHLYACSRKEKGKILTSVRRSGRSVKISSRFQDVKEKILKTIKNQSLKEETCLKPETHSNSQILTVSESKDSDLESHSSLYLFPEHSQNKTKISGSDHKCNIKIIDKDEENSKSNKRSCPLCKTVIENEQPLEVHMQVHIPSSSFYSCDLCRETYSSLGSLRRHLLSHLGMPIKHNLCLFCGNTFKSESLLVTHIRKRHSKEFNSNSFQCPKCPKKFKTKDQLDFHSVRHADIKPYACEVCGKTFMREKGLLSHMRMHEGGGFMCAVCGKSFVSQRVLEDHCTIHTGEKPHICDVCGKSFRLMANLRNHKQVHCPNKGIQCPECPKTFRDTRSYSRHMLMHTGERPWRCTVCGKGFVQEITLKKHMNLHNGKNLHQCKVCLRSFVDKWGLLKHSTIHTGERPYECNVCHRTFRIKRSLEYHMKLHDVSLKLSCPLCPKTFVEKRHLEHHLRVHRGEKAYVCEICGDRFVNSMSLKVHLRRHTGEKPYKCSYCPKTFNQHGTHAAHERYHRGERPYACDFCDAAFITHSQLNIHRRKHLNIRPYKCTQCDYAATTASLLKVHSLKHSSEKPFRCSVCPAAFKRQNHLDAHMKKHQVREEIIVEDENTNIIHISNPSSDPQPEIVAPGRRNFGTSN
ncbi:zinc finger protein 62 [Elysia marginata]|uniref:Zinc finger protein 62 n=1 Tax=Elysia marginata TaxID=1093978 RepID=A0AAV4JVR7_9GAST|nr:zinc finger protein 62 [Elysia marginata]